jgi:hypothetical protein
MSATGQIRLPFGLDSQGRISFTTDPTTIGEQKLLTYLLTMPSERVFRGKWGTRLQAYVFANIDPLQWEILNTTITESVAANVIGVYLQSLSTAVDPSTSSQVNVTVQFGLSLGGDVGATGTTTISTGGS